jgi:hypothetical protein
MYCLAQSVRQLAAKMPAFTVQAANGRQIHSLGMSRHTILVYLNLSIVDLYSNPEK